MYQLLSDNPWIIPIILGCSIPIIAIIFGTVTDHLRKTHQADLDAHLKQEMIQRGMSAEEIVAILQARSTPGKNGRSA